MDITSPTSFIALTTTSATSIGENRTCSPSEEEEVLFFAIFTIPLCVFGMLGNGLVIWLLGSSVKRNTFAIYIINLSAADFGLLTIELIIQIHWLCTRLYCGFPYELFLTVWLLMYISGQFHLTAISIDRCVSVLSPIWYRCHRPVHMFTSVCTVIWAISFILASIYFTIVSVGRYEWTDNFIYPFMINAVLFLPLMTISSVTLFIKICFVSKSQRRRKLLTAILLTLFFFLALAYPVNVFYFILYFKTIHLNFIYCGHLCNCINSCINPVIYYLVGRHGGKARKNIKDLFQKVFKEEELSSDELETSEGSKIGMI
ncbi:mas-related G-protein coupled receptor member H-like [Erythrolamprus reginae]|uniref:mas-related G-protein coupled receptor member H-like n=1 Tax=Erythrolamprus reginae TaxID=121349 RepID=UPI00396CCA12